MPQLPSGLVTFLFTDVERSTQLLELHGRAMEAALTRHHELLEEAIEGHGGMVFETVGDAAYAAFGRPTDGVTAAVEVQQAVAAENWGQIDRLAMRLAVHTGEVERRGMHYVGAALFRAARLQALAHGEQALVSGATARLVAEALPASVSMDCHSRSSSRRRGFGSSISRLSRSA